MHPRIREELLLEAARLRIGIWDLVGEILYRWAADRIMKRS